MKKLKPTKKNLEDFYLIEKNLMIALERFRKDKNICFLKDFVLEWGKYLAYKEIFDLQIYAILYDMQLEIYSLITKYSNYKELEETKYEII